MSIVYCVWIEPEAARPSRRGVVIWLDPEVNTSTADAWAGKRVTDLAVGDPIRHRGRPYRVLGVKAYREHEVTPQFLRRCCARDGFSNA